METLLDTRHAAGEVALSRRWDALEAGLQEIRMLVRSRSGLNAGIPLAFGALSGDAWAEKP